MKGISSVVSGMTASRNIITIPIKKHAARIAALCSVATLTLLLWGCNIGRVAAACTAPTIDYGTVSNTVSVPATATYRVWTRMNVPDATNNTYLLQVDNTCYSVGGGTVPVGAWAWVAYQNGTASSFIDIPLSQGAHTLKMVGNKPGVKIDRVALVSDLACTPTSTTGNECNVPPDTSVPAVHITSPVANATVSGAVAVNATASDNVAVTKTELYVNTTLVATDTASPYSFQWNTASYANGSQLVTVKAYDAAGNVGTDGFQVTVANGDGQAPSVPTGLSVSAPAYNTVSVSWQASTDNVGVASYTVLRDTVPIATVSGTSYSDTQVSAGATYSYQVLAADSAGNKSAASTAVKVTTPTVPDTQKPSAPGVLTAMAVSSSQVNLSWQASTDNIGVVAYDVYRATAGGTATKAGSATTTSFGDTGLTANTVYSYYVIARDAAGNQSAQSSQATATTLVAQQKSTITGVVMGRRSRPIAGATVTITIGATKRTIQTNSVGKYAIDGLDAGRYSVTYRATGYYSRSYSIRVDANVTVIKNVTLQSR